MRTLLIALCLTVLFSVSAYAELDDYYKFVNKYNDDRHSFIELKKRAESGDVAAQSELGTIYFEGRPPGLPQNIKKAHKWWGKAAEAGDAHAQYHMGFLSLEGLSKMAGVEGDTEKARDYIKKSAESGYRDAQKMMMGMSIGSDISDFLKGEPDLIEAYKWAGLAVGEGEDMDEEVATAIKELEDMMTTSELKRAKGVLKRAISKRDAGKDGMGAYNRNR